MSLEKYGNSEFVVYWENSKLVMRIPGSDTTVPYDGRFGDLSTLALHNSHVVPVEKEGN